MNILILGAGAMGSLYGALLAKAGYEITLLDIDEEKVDTINSNGVHVTGIEEFEMHPKATIKPPLKPPSVIFIFTKSYSTDDALRSVKHLITSKTLLVTLQNGLGNEEIARKYADKVIGGVTTYAAVLENPGVVRWAGRGISIIGGYPTGIPSYVYTVREVLSDAGFNTITTDNIIGWKWLKAIVNSAINPIGALLHVKNGYILETSVLKQLALDIVREGRRIAVRQGVNIPGKPGEMLVKTLQSTRENYNSMLQDLSRCRRTEIDYINGRILEVARKAGLKAPLNQALWSLIKALELKCTTSTDN
ncbi:MAG: 2-dehydropantoate 2-reductase [Desulfurococcales archaeon]|nr:2-dehydropantoate 2-reductase [Desulfurococcales archaeon]